MLLDESFKRFDDQSWQVCIWLVTFLHVSAYGHDGFEQSALTAT